MKTEKTCQRKEKADETRRKLYEAAGFEAFRITDERIYYKYFITALTTASAQANVFTPHSIPTQ